MKILLVEGAPGTGHGVARELSDAGHTVIGCDGADAAAPCRGLETVGDCPLDAHDVDVAVVARSGPAMSVSERGALCASRDRVPVVLSCDPRDAISFGPGTTLAGRDVVGAVERAATNGEPHAAAVRHDLIVRRHLEPGDLDGPHATVSIAVRRSPDGLHLEVSIPTDDPRQPAVVAAAEQALRHFDQHAATISVSVVHP